MTTVIANYDELSDWVDRITCHKLQPGFVGRIATQLTYLAGRMKLNGGDDWAALLDPVGEIIGYLEPAAHWERKT